MEGLKTKKMSNLNPIFENILVSHGMKKSEKEFTAGDLVMVRLNNGIKDAYRQPHYNVWLRVKFIDNDSTFIGEIERKISINNIIGIYRVLLKSRGAAVCRKVNKKYNIDLIWNEPEYPEYMAKTELFL